MTGRDFMQYMLSQMPSSYVDGEDPGVDFHEGIVRVAESGDPDALRGTCVLPPNPRQLRAVAQQLQMIADEIERRRFE
jgi:hypothetical protein